MGLAIKNDTQTLECYINSDGNAVVNLQDGADDVYFGGVFVFESLSDLKHFGRMVDSVIYEMEKQETENE